jgi:hypothetical protein
MRTGAKYKRLCGHGLLEEDTLHGSGRGYMRTGARYKKLCGHGGWKIASRMRHGFAKTHLIAAQIFRWRRQKATTPSGQPHSPPHPPLSPALPPSQPYLVMPSFLAQRPLPTNPPPLRGPGRLMRQGGPPALHSYQSCSALPFQQSFL